MEELWTAVPLEGNAFVYGSIYVDSTAEGHLSSDKDDGDEGSGKK